jgi:uncharacterized membrane protein
MSNTQFYLPALLPQWAIFAGVVSITLGYVEKKDFWTRLGWIILITTGLIGAYFNLFGELSAITEEVKSGTMTALLISTGWKAAAGGILAANSLLMFQKKKKMYTPLAILTLIYFVLIFFLYYQTAINSAKTVKSGQHSEQKL